MTIAQPLARLAIPIADLMPDPANARRHGEKNLDAIKASLASFGQRKPIVVQREGMIVRAGNGTLAAAKALGWEEIAAVVIDDDNATASQFAIADNRTGELAEWDDETLGALLDGMDEPIRELLAFDDGDMRKLLGRLEPDEVTEDTAPEPPADPVTKTGDLILLGDHRLLCGDSTNPQHVERLMDGKKADMVFTDPPYGISIVGSNGKVGGDNLAKNGVYAPVAGDGSIDVALDAIELIKTLSSKTQIIWGGNYYANALANTASWVVWDKRGDMASNNFADCELAWCNLGSPARIYKQVWSGMIKEGESGKRVHPTQKPVALAEWCFENYGEPGTVLDLFLGSGSTLIACEQTGRACYGMELSPAYCDVIVERWENLTGGKAVRS